MYNLGLFALFLFNFLTSVKGVYLGAFLQRVPPMMVLAICFSVVTVFFIIYNRMMDQNVAPIIPVAKKNFKQVIGLNISALIGWTGFYYALKLIEPAIVTSLTSASGPILTAIYYSLTEKEKRYSNIEWALFVCLALVMGYLVVESYYGYSAVRDIPFEQAMLGTVAALICGVANVATILLSKNLNDAGLKARHIIPLRFCLLIVVGSFFCTSSQWANLGQEDFYLSIFMISLLGIATPVLLFQVGVENTNPITVANVHATIPIFVLAAQLFDQRLVPSQYSIVGAFALTLLSMAAFAVKFSQKPVLMGVKG